MKEEEIHKVAFRDVVYFAKMYESYLETDKHKCLITWDSRGVRVERDGHRTIVVPASNISYVEVA